MATGPKQDQEFIDYLLDLYQVIGPVTAKRMFGGHGIFLDGLMFGLVADRCLYLKADDESAGQFETLGLSRFIYYKKGKPFSLSYYEAPEDALETADSAQTWGNIAFAAAIRGANKKKRPKKP